MRRFIIFIVIVVLLGGGFYYFGQQQQARLRAETLANLQLEEAVMGSLTATVGATGIVRSNQSAVLVWNSSGTVGSVNVRSGDQVSTDDVLSEIKTTTLPQNVILAQADLVSAQNALDDLLSPTPLQEAQALKNIEDARQALEDRLNPTELQLAVALEAITDAEKAVEDAERRLYIVQIPADQASIDAQKAQVILAEDALSRAQDRYEPFENKPEDNLIRANLLAALSAAQQSYDSAVRRLNALEGTGSPLDISIAEADLATAQAQLLQAQEDYQDLVDGPSEAEISLLEAQITDAEEAYDELLAGADPDDIAAAEARVAAAQATLDSVYITAPFDGTISDVLVKPGDLVSPGSVAFHLDDLSRLLVDVEVSEVDINRIQVGQQAILTFDAVLAREYSGLVTDVSFVGTTVQGVVSFKVTIEILDADENVRPGMTAGVNIVVSQLENVLLVPNRAVRILEGDRVVYILDDSDPLPKPVAIELGSSSDTHSEIVGGDLSGGDQIVLNPPSDFSSFFGGGPPGGGGN